MQSNTSIVQEEREKRHKQLMLQNALLTKARKRKFHQSAGQEIHSSASSSNRANPEKEDDIFIVELRSSNCDRTKGKAKEGKKEEVQIIEEKISGQRNEDEDEERMRAKLLQNMATQALVRDAKRSAQRAQLVGPQGWLKPRSLTTNKVFLARTLQSVELDRREREKAIAEKRDVNRRHVDQGRAHGHREVKERRIRQ